MTIQLPVLLWTVISFCLFVFILNKLLWKPMLTFMDARQARIDAAMQKKVDYERALADCDAQLAAHKIEQARHTAELCRVELDGARADAEAIAAEAVAARAKKLAEREDELEAQTRAMIEAMDADVDKLADAYISTLVS